MIGAIIGDIAGSRFEFNNTDNYNFEFFGKGCDFTDDTVCTIAVADAILKNKPYKESMLCWCRKYPNPKGAYGGMFSRWIHSANPQPYDSFGNGSAMRVSPVGWAYNTDSEILREAIESAKISHSHTEGLIGAIAVAMFIMEARKDNAAKEHRVELVNSIVSRFYGANWLKWLPSHGYFDGTCQGCVPLALKIISESKSFEDAVRQAVAYGGDSDTMGAIVGSMAEPLFGVPSEMVKQALSYLPDDIKAVIVAFRKKYC